MIGVVLWRDATAAKAVIWCEDQGDLAFYSQSTDQDRFDICVGDWVSVELELHGNLRVAVDLSVLPEAPSPTLIEDLVATGHLSALSSVAEISSETDEIPSSDQSGPLIKNSVAALSDCSGVGGKTLKSGRAVAQRPGMDGMPAVHPPPADGCFVPGAKSPPALFHRLNVAGGKDAKPDANGGAKDQSAANNVVTFPSRGKGSRWSA